MVQEGLRRFKKIQEGSGRFKKQIVFLKFHNAVHFLILHTFKLDLVCITTKNQSYSSSWPELALLLLFPSSDPTLRFWVWEVQRVFVTLFKNLIKHLMNLINPLIQLINYLFKLINYIINLINHFMNIIKQLINLINH